LNTGNFGTDIPVSVFCTRETIGSLKFPSYPFKYMPWSKTTVVSTKLVMALSGLLPSVRVNTSAFPPPEVRRSLSNDHN